MPMQAARQAHGLIGPSLTRVRNDELVRGLRCLLDAGRIAEGPPKSNRAVLAKALRPKEKATGTSPVASPSPGRNRANPAPV